MISAVRDVITDGVVTLLDAMLVRRASDDGMEILEVEAFQGTDTIDLTVTELSASGLVGEEDLPAVADSIEPATSALVVLLAHTWARAVATAIPDVGAALVGAERISAEAMNEVAQAAAH